jgi:hypothetical protein
LIKAKKKCDYFSGYKTAAEFPAAAFVNLYTTLITICAKGAAMEKIQKQENVRILVNQSPKFNM